jgi:hypothetical protein
VKSSQGHMHRHTVALWVVGFRNTFVVLGNVHLIRALASAEHECMPRSQLNER